MAQEAVAPVVAVMAATARLAQGGAVVQEATEVEMEVTEVEMGRCASLLRRCSISLEGFCHSTDTAHTCKPANQSHPR